MGRLNNKAPTFDCYWESEDEAFLDPLYIVENGDLWKHQPDEHKWAAQIESFSYVRDPDGRVVDMAGFSTTPMVNE